MNIQSKSIKIISENIYLFAFSLFFLLLIMRKCNTQSTYDVNHFFNQFDENKFNNCINIQSKSIKIIFENIYLFAFSLFF